METLTIEAHRIVLGILLFVSGGISVTNTWSHNPMSYTQGGGPARLLRSFTGRFLIPGLLYGFAILAWVLGVKPLWSGLIAILLLIWFQRAEKNEWPGQTVVGLGSYAPAGVCLLGVCCGRALWHVGVLPSASDGWHIAAGMLGGAWTIAGMNKLQKSGLRWMGVRNIALIVAERTVIGSQTGRRLRRWLVRSPKMLRMMGLIGVFGELAGVFFCFPQCRPAFAGFVCVFLFLNWLLLGFMEHEWALVMVVIAAAA